jgi:hypothetical protein
MEPSTNNFKISRSTAMQRILITLLTLIWAPLLFINFDSHHDGLMLTTINSLRAALTGGQDWPFNQYGSFWAFPYVLFSYLFPSSLTYFSMRVLAVICYLFSAYLISKVAKLLGHERAGFWAVLAFLGSQPYVSDFGSDLVPWPSSIAMPLVMLLTLQILKISLRPTLSLGREAFMAGVLVSWVSLSRIQIGAALFVSIFVYFLLFFKTSVRWLFPLGFFSSITIFSLFLQFNNWLKDSLIDQIIFGSSYIREDIVGYPFPIFTYIGTLVFLVCLCFATQASRFFQNKISSRYSMVVLVLGFFVIFTTSLLNLKGRKMDIVNSLTTLSRRAWICATLATLIFAGLRQLVRTIILLRSKKQLDTATHSLNLLVGIGILSQLQVWPLFDQMHYWWGSVPSILVLVIILSEIKDSARLAKTSSSRARILVFAVILLITFVPWITQINKSRNAFIPKYIGFVQVSKNQAINEEELQKFFHTYLEKEESILNFCDNTNVFFDADFVRPASRLFLLWTGFRDLDSYRANFESAQFSSVVTCSLAQAPMLTAQLVIDQGLLIQHYKPKLKMIATYREPTGKVWEIWRR